MNMESRTVDLLKVVVLIKTAINYAPLNEQSYTEDRFSGRKTTQLWLLAHPDHMVDH